MIRLNNITKQYDEIVVIKDFTYEFKKGKIYLIMGESGAGKTTLLNLISCFEDVTSGEILINNANYPKSFSKKATSLYSNHFSFVFQDYFLLEDETILANIKYCISANQNGVEQELIKLMRSLNIDKSPATLVRTLSGGQKQRISIIRALLKSHDVLICDEPTGNLDEHNAEAIRNIIKQNLSMEHVIIISSHDPKMKDIADEIIYLGKEKNEES